MGIVELVDIIPLGEDDYANHSDEERLATRTYRTPMYGWVLRAPKRLSEIIPLPGRRNLFNVALDIGSEAPKRSGNRVPHRKAKHQQAPFPHWPSLILLPSSPAPAIHYRSSCKS